MKKLMLFAVPLVLLAGCAGTQSLRVRQIQAEMDSLTAQIESLKRQYVPPDIRIRTLRQKVNTLDIKRKLGLD